MGILADAAKELKLKIIPHLGLYKVFASKTFMYGEIGQRLHIKMWVCHVCMELNISYGEIAEKPRRHMTVGCFKPGGFCDYNVPHKVKIVSTKTLKQTIQAYRGKINVWNWFPEELKNLIF